MLQVQKEFVNYSLKENILIGNIKCISIYYLMTGKNTTYSLS